MAMPDDKVSLLIHTRQSYMHLFNVTRAEAAQWIKDWFDMREQIRLDGPKAKEAAYFLTYGTIAANERMEDGTVLSRHAVAWADIVGMQIDDREPTKGQASERLAAIQERFFDLMIRQAKKDEEWRGDEEEP